MVRIDHQGLHNIHFQALARDGAYPYAPSQGHPPSFLALPPPEPADVARVLAGAGRRIQRVIEAHDADDPDALERDVPLLALVAAASLRTRIATGPNRGAPWRRLGDRVEPHDIGKAEVDPEAPDRVPQYGKMSLHVAVASLIAPKVLGETLASFACRDMCTARNSMPRRWPRMAAGLGIRNSLIGMQPGSVQSRRPAWSG